METTETEGGYSDLPSGKIFIDLDFEQSKVEKPTPAQLLNGKLKSPFHEKSVFTLEPLAETVSKTQGWIVGALFLLFPLMNLFNPSDFKIRAVVHGLFTSMTLGLGAYLGYLDLYDCRNGTRSRHFKSSIYLVWGLWMRY
jgi:hypothetical protein